MTQARSARTSLTLGHPIRTHSRPDASKRAFRPRPLGTPEPLVAPLTISFPATFHFPGLGVRGQRSYESGAHFCNRVPCVEAAADHGHQRHVALAKGVAVTPPPP